MQMPGGTAGSNAPPRALHHQSRRIAANIAGQSLGKGHLRRSTPASRRARRVQPSQSRKDCLSERRWPRRIPVRRAACLRSLGLPCRCAPDGRRAHSTQHCSRRPQFLQECRQTNDQRNVIDAAWVQSLAPRGTQAGLTADRRFPILLCRRAPGPRCAHSSVTSGSCQHGGTGRHRWMSRLRK